MAAMQVYQPASLSVTFVNTSTWGSSELVMLRPSCGGVMSVPVSHGTLIINHATLVFCILCCVMFLVDVIISFIIAVSIFYSQAFILSPASYLLSPSINVLSLPLSQHHLLYPIDCKSSVIYLHPIIIFFILIIVVLERARIYCTFQYITKAALRRETKSYVILESHETKNC